MQADGMTDLQLLELAAKAAGFKISENSETKNYDVDRNNFWLRLENGPLGWRPLSDDGDALRLAVKLGFSVEVRRKNHDNDVPHAEVYGYVYRKSLATEIATDNDESLLAATRRAIVRAAASVGSITL